MAGTSPAPDCAPLHPGYACYRVSSPIQVQFAVELNSVREPTIQIFPSVLWSRESAAAVWQSGSGTDVSVGLPVILSRRKRTISSLMGHAIRKSPFDRAVWLLLQIVSYAFESLMLVFGSSRRQIIWPCRLSFTTSTGRALDVSCQLEVV